MEATEADWERWSANTKTHGKIEPCGPHGELGRCPICGAAEVEIELYSCKEFKERKHANT